MVVIVYDCFGDLIGVGHFDSETEANQIAKAMHDRWAERVNIKVAKITKDLAHDVEWWVE